MKISLPIQILIPNVNLKNHEIVVEVNWFLQFKPKRREIVISMIFHRLEDGPNTKKLLNHLTHSYLEVSRKTNIGSFLRIHSPIIFIVSCAYRVIIKKNTHEMEPHILGLACWTIPHVC